MPHFLVTVRRELEFSCEAASREELAEAIEKADVERDFYGWYDETMIIESRGTGEAECGVAGGEVLAWCDYVAALAGEEEEEFELPYPPDRRTLPLPGVEEEPD